MATTKIPAEFLANNTIVSLSIAENIISTRELAANGITSAQIASNAVLTRHIDDNQITGAQIADNAVGTDQLAGIARGKIIVGDASGNPALLTLGTNGYVLKSDGSDISWAAEEAVAANSVTSAKIASNSILTRHLDDDQVTGDQLADALTVVTSVTTPLVDAAIVDGENFKVNGGQGTDGQVLTSTGSGVAWEAVAGGATFKTFGTSSIMVGDDTTGTIDAANYNTGLGIDVFAALTSGDSNVAIGFKALTGTTTGTNNTALGDGAGYRLTTGNDNTILGNIENSGVGAMTSSSNTFVGRSAGESNTSGNSNTYIGSLCGDLATTGNTNTGVGGSALTNLSTGANNVAVGASSMAANTTGGSNTAVGGGALGANTTAANNTAVGFESLKANTTGTRNTAIGALALDTITTTTDDTAVGYKALTACTSGDANTAVGSQCLDACTSGNNNTAMGNISLSAATTAHYNTSIGSGTMRYSTGDSNTAVGRGALGGSNDTGSRNTAIGYEADKYNEYGSDNTTIGHLAVSTASGAGNAVGRITIGDTVTGYAQEWVTFGRGGTRTRVALGTTTWYSDSDERLKENIQTSTAGLSFINGLRPVTFDWKKKGEIAPSFTLYKEGSEDRIKFQDNLNRYGFIAQEVKQAIDTHSILENGEIWQEDEVDGAQGIAPTGLIPMLVKSIQDLKALNDALTIRIETLEG